MESLRFTARTKKLEFCKIPVPKIDEPTQVLIKVAYAGVCGTDLKIIDGGFECNPDQVLTLGHELCGTVVDVGSEVKIFKKGDIVAADPNSGCKCCHHCHMGKPQFCKVGRLEKTIGIFRDGGFAQYVVVPIDQVHKVPDTINMEQAALSEPLSCLAHAWDIISPVTIGSKILITGAGIIGNLWVCILHLQGHRNVTVSEPNKSRLDLLKKLDTGYTLITPDILKKNQQDPEYLFDLIIDCSGYPPAVENNVTLLQCGGKMCCFGIAPSDGKISIAPFDIYMKELKIFGVNMNPFSFPKSMGLLEAMGDRYLNYNNLGIKTYPLKDYQKALDALKKGEIAKALFKM